MADHSIRPGFNIMTQLGPGLNLTRKDLPTPIDSASRAPTADKALFSPRKADYWLDGYRTLLEAKEGAVEPSRGISGALEITGPRGGKTVVAKDKVIDGRTVHGLNKRMASLLSAGVSEAKAKEMALNTLARYRKSVQSAPQYQAQKTAKRGRKPKP